MNETPSEPVQPGQPSSDQPSWGTPPTSPPTGSGSDSGPYHQQSASSGQPGARFFDAIRRLGIVRPDRERRAAGVAAGLARRWNVDPLAVRIGFVLLALLGGLGVTLYGLGWMLLPHPDGRIHAQQVLTGTVTAGFFGALVTILLSGPQFHGPLLVVALIALIVWIVAGRRHHQYQGC